MDVDEVRAQWGRALDAAGHALDAAAHWLSAAELVGRRHALARERRDAATLLTELSRVLR
jgi:hypothetical protein